VDTIILTRSSNAVTRPSLSPRQPHPSCRSVRSFLDVNNSHTLPLRVFLARPPHRIPPVFSLLSTAFALVYVCGLGRPALFWVALRYYGISDFSRPSFLSPPLFGLLLSRALRRIDGFNRITRYPMQRTRGGIYIQVATWVMRWMNNISTLSTILTVI
jgi:hypothetical protein